MTSKIADSLFPLLSHSVLVLHDLFWFYYSAHMVFCAIVLMANFAV